MTKLWENPNPSASFAAQDITLSSSDYDLLLVQARYSTSYEGLCPSAIGMQGYIVFPEYSSGVKSHYRRYTANANDKTQLGFTDAKDNGVTANNLLIPTAIYGIKLTATVKINAIAMDVSTSADKCMLSDGDSVEDRVNAHALDNKYVSLSFETEYIVPNDGYARIAVNTGTDKYVDLQIKSNTGAWATIIRAGGNQIISGIDGLFVKKGMHIRLSGSASTDVTCRYYPIIME